MNRFLEVRRGLRPNQRCLIAYHADGTGRLWPGALLDPDDGATTFRTIGEARRFLRTQDPWWGMRKLLMELGHHAPPLRSTDFYLVVPEGTRGCYFVLRSIDIMRFTTQRS